MSARRAVKHEQEARLLARARDGDREAMRDIVEQHQSDVYYLALGLLGQRGDAEDAMQDVFVKAMKSIKRFRGDSGLSTWLYRITVNTCRDQQRKKRWTFFSLSNNDDQMPEFQRPEINTSQEIAVTDTALRARLHAAMNRLTQSERQVFTLREFQELSVRETSQVLGLAEGSVKALLHRALKKLRNELADCRPAEEGVR